MSKHTGIELDFDTADRIALAVMVQHRKYLKKEVKAHLKKGEYLHPEDLVEYQTKLLPAFELLIKYFGGKDE